MQLRMTWKTGSVNSSSRVQGQQWNTVCLFREEHYKRFGNQVIQERMADFPWRQKKKKIR